MARTALVGAALACWMTCAACTESSPPVGPSEPTLATLTGTVFETTPDGRRPVPGAYLNALGGGGDSISAYADAEGRYAFTNKRIGATVLVQAVSIPGVRVPRHQPCIASVVMQKDSVVDVEFNLAGVPGTGGPPFVSGTIFLTTSTGRQPLPNRQVLYYVVGSSGGSGLATFTITDDRGRYEFCKVPLGAGKVWVSDPYDYELGNPAALQDVFVSGGETVVDLDVPR